MNYYEDKLKEGKKYEEFIKKVFFERFAINLDFTGKDNQINIGETLQGIEVKYDKRFAQTNNIYIEEAEKSDASNQEYVASGIRRKDNTWLYVIGNYETIYIFGKKDLIRLKDIGIARITPTSMGFTLNEEQADEYCLKKITAKGNLDNG